MDQEQKDTLETIMLEAPTYYDYTRDGFFVREAKADLDPGEYEINGKVVWMLPAQATWEPPPVTTESQVAVFNAEDGTWALVLKEVAEAVAEPATVPLSVQVHRVCAAIDQQVDAITFAAIGHRAQEYLQAEKEAEEFLGTGVVGEALHADMAAYERTAEEAAAAILAQAQAWRKAQEGMRYARLHYKQLAKKASSVQDLSLVVDDWNATIDAIDAELGG